MTRKAKDIHHIFVEMEEIGYSQNSRLVAIGRGADKKHGDIYIINW